MATDENGNYIGMYKRWKEDDEYWAEQARKMTRRQIKEMREEIKRIDGGYSEKLWAERQAYLKEQERKRKQEQKNSR